MIGNAPFFKHLDFFQNISEISTWDFEVFDSKLQQNVMAHKKSYINHSMCFITYKIFMATL